MADITKINESPQKAQTSAFEDLRAELAHLLKKKAEKTERLAALERQIYIVESAYLQYTQDFGNAIKGWDKYSILNKVRTRKHVKLNRQLNEAERIFSKSSVTSLIACKPQSS